MTPIFKYEVKTQKQTIFRQSLFGNYHSTLNYLSNGIKYLYIFFLVLKILKNISKLNEIIFKKNNFTYCIPFERKFNVE